MDVRYVQHVKKTRSERAYQTRISSGGSTMSMMRLDAPDSRNAGTAAPMMGQMRMNTVRQIDAIQSRAPCEKKK